MQGLFSVKQTHYNLRSSHHFGISSRNSVYQGSENISHLGPRIWNLVPNRLKERNGISYFNNEINI